MARLVEPLHSEREMRDAIIGFADHVAGMAWTYRRPAGIVARPPRQFAGELPQDRQAWRQLDYRYCWIRDCDPDAFNCAVWELRLSRRARAGAKWLLAAGPRASLGKCRFM